MPEIKNIEQKEVWAVEVIECERGWVVRLMRFAISTPR